MDALRYPGYERFLEEGETYFNYLLDHYDKMINEEKKILTHFTIRDGIPWITEHVEKVKNTYISDIKNKLIPWIINEHKSKDLFIKTNWKPFRDQYIMTTMFFGYKKMFNYNEYWFQLAIDWMCDNQCICDETENMHPHFVLALYGWDDRTNEQLQPNNVFSIPVDNKIPDDYWFLES